MFHDPSHGGDYADEAARLQDERDRYRLAWLSACLRAKEKAAEEMVWASHVGREAGRASVAEMRATDLQRRIDAALAYGQDDRTEAILRGEVAW